MANNDGKIRRSVTIEQRHEEFIKEQELNFSGFCRRALDDYIEYTRSQEGFFLAEKRD